MFLTSSDGIAWTKRIFGEKLGLYAIGYGNGRWVAVGDEGLIISSGETGTPPELTITVGERNAFVSWAADVAGFGLESTTNPAASQSRAVITNLPTVMNSRQTIIDSLSAPARFYRLRKD